MQIEAVEVSAYTVPTDYPESDGTLEWDKTTIAICEAPAGVVCGLGYTDLATAQVAKGLLAVVVLHRDAMDVEGSWVEMVRAVRNLGRPGIASMAIAAVDSALWTSSGGFWTFLWPNFSGWCARERLFMAAEGSLRTRHASSKINCEAGSTKEFPA